MGRRMKITVGLGTIDDFLSFVRAGADECFAGYVPGFWNTDGGELAALNRREVSYYQVQIGSRSEMEILGHLSRKTGVPVTVTLNSPFYLPKQYDRIPSIIRDCLSMGFSSYIIADPALLLRLKQEGLSQRIHIHISGELGEMNREVMEYCAAMKASRVIFHRKVSLKEMEDMIPADRRESGYGKMMNEPAMSEMTGDPERRKMEYEAFALNEMCHFHGGFCYSLHCDALPHMCRVPYRMGAVDAAGPGKAETGNRSAYGTGEICDEQEIYIPGASGCGLCALWRMREIGITHLKLVSRGNYSDETVRDIGALRRALDILEEAWSEEDYLRKMKAELFPSGCSGNCYYRY